MARVMYHLISFNNLASLIFHRMVAIEHLAYMYVCMHVPNMLKGIINYKL